MARLDTLIPYLDALGRPRRPRQRLLETLPLLPEAEPGTLETLPLLPEAEPGTLETLPLLPEAEPGTAEKLPLLPGAFGSLRALESRRNPLLDVLDLLAPEKPMAEGRYQFPTEAQTEQRPQTADRRLQTPEGGTRIQPPDERMRPGPAPGDVYSGLSRLARIPERPETRDQRPETRRGGFGSPDNIWTWLAAAIPGLFLKGGARKSASRALAGGLSGLYNTKMREREAERGAAAADVEHQRKLEEIRAQNEPEMYRAEGEYGQGGAKWEGLGIDQQRVDNEQRHWENSDAYDTARMHYEAAKDSLSSAIAIAKMHTRPGGTIWSIRTTEDGASEPFDTQVPVPVGPGEQAQIDRDLELKRHAALSDLIDYTGYTETETVTDPKTGKTTQREVFRPGRLSHPEFYQRAGIPGKVAERRAIAAAEAEATFPYQAGLKRMGGGGGGGGGGGAGRVPAAYNPNLPGTPAYRAMKAEAGEADKDAAFDQWIAGWARTPIGMKAKDPNNPRKALVSFGPPDAVTFQKYLSKNYQTLQRMWGNARLAALQDLISSGTYDKIRNSPAKAQGILQSFWSGGK